MRINGYFEQEIEAIFSDKNGLYFAIHEFAFAEQDQRDRLNQRIKASIDILMFIFTYGQEKSVQLYVNIIDGSVEYPNEKDIK